MEIGTEYLSQARESFQKYRALADRAMEQVSDKQFFAVLGEESNSIAVIVKHMAGNLHSRWTDFLISDGEKPDRDRDAEFELSDSDTRETLLDGWERGWECASRAMDAHSPEDLSRTVYIRGEPHSVVQAINRHLAHAAYHVGQIVLLAKYLKAGAWRTLSIPRGESQEYNARMRSRPSA